MALSMPPRDAEEALGGALARQERVVALVDVAGDERGREGVGAGLEDRRHAADVGRQARRGERALELRGRHEHLAAEVAALLLGRELVLEVHARGAGLDHRPHQLEGVERAAEAGLGVGHDRREPVHVLVAALRPGDPVGPQQRVVDALDVLRRRVGGIEALVRVGVAGRVRVGGDLPARQVDRLQPGLHHLDGLQAGLGAEGGDVRLVLQQLPQALGAEAREAVLDPHRPAEANDLVGAVRAVDAVPARVEAPLVGQSPGLLRPSIDAHRASVRVLPGVHGTAGYR